MRPDKSFLEGKVWYRLFNVINWTLSFGAAILALAIWYSEYFPMSEEKFVLSFESQYSEVNFPEINLWELSAPHSLQKQISDRIQMGNKREVLFSSDEFVNYKKELLNKGEQMDSWNVIKFLAPKASPPWRVKIWKEYTPSLWCIIPFLTVGPIAYFFLRYLFMNAVLYVVYGKSKNGVEEIK